MALWAKAQQLPPEGLQQIRAIYGDHFPIEVRHYLAQYIEEKFWYFLWDILIHMMLITTIYFRTQQIDHVPDNPQYEQYVAALVNSLINEIDNKAAAVVTEGEYFLIKLKLAEAAKMFRLRYRLVIFF